MKFTSLAFLGLALATFNPDLSVDAALTRGTTNKQKSEDRLVIPRRQLKKSKSKDSSDDGDGGACPTCAEQLPGYAFFGQNYLDGDFWGNLLEAAFPGIPSGSSPSGSGDNGFPVDPEFGVDYLVPGPFGFSAGGNTCYDTVGTLVTCGLITFLSEIIYKSDLLRCLLTSLATTLRDLACLDALTRRRILTESQNAGVERALEEESSGPMSAETILFAGLPLIGVTTAADFARMFGIDEEIAEHPLVVAAAAQSGRKLGPVVRNSGDGGDEFTEEAGDFLEDFLGYGNSDVELAVKDNIFFASCTIAAGLPAGLCALLFGVVKTLDASVCYYREELGCGSETCTKDLKFDVSYATERLALDLFPFVPLEIGLIVADILAPCGACVNEKSDGCAAFCNIYESYHTCDATKVAYLTAVGALNTAPMITFNIAALI